MNTLSDEEFAKQFGVDADAPQDGAPLAEAPEAQHEPPPPVEAEASPPSVDRGDLNVALQSERQRLRETRERLQQIEREREQDRNNYAQTLEIIRQRAQQQAPQPEAPATPSPIELLAQEPPDPFDDPEGARRHQQAMVQATREIHQRQEQAARQQQEMMQHAQRRAQLHARGRSDMQAFQQHQPDALQAINAWAQSQRAQYAAMGFSADQAERQLDQNVDQIIALAAQNRRNSAELIYNMAREVGYQPAAQAPALGQAAPPPMPQQMPQQRVAPQQAQRPSLGQAAGPTAQSGRMTADQILSMSPKALAEMSSDDFGRSLGLF